MIVLGGFALISVANATVPDVYGSGGRLIAMGGGGVAIVEDGASAAVNPAGLYRIRRPTVALGFSAGFARFDPVGDLYWDTNRDGKVDSVDEPLHFDVGVQDQIGFSFSAGRNVGGKFGVGVSGYVPAQRLLVFRMFEPSLPNYFMFDDRQQRYTFTAGIGGQPIKGLAIGAGIDFVPKARFEVDMEIDAVLHGADPDDNGIEDLVGDVTVDVHRMDLDLVPDFAPIVGVQLDLGQWSPRLKGFWLAAAYRGSVGLPITVDLDLQANVDLEDVGDLDPLVFAIILDAQLALFDHYVPSVLSLGAAYRNSDVVTISVDVRNTNWKPMELNVARVLEANVTSPLVDIDDSIHDGNEFDVDLRSVWGVRAGCELWLPKIELDNDLRYLRFFARGGFQYEPSPLKSQGSRSALLDADRTAFAMGAGTEFWDPLELVDGPVRIDLFGQHQILASGELARPSDPDDPGSPVNTDRIPVGGGIWLFGAQWGFDY